MGTVKNKKKSNIILLLFFGIFPIISLTAILCIYIWYAPSEDYSYASFEEANEPVVIVLGNPQEDRADTEDIYKGSNIVADSEPQKVSEIVHESREYFGVNASKQAALEKEVDELMELTNK